MNKIDSFNHLEKFIKKQEAFDNLVKWGLVIFLLMACIIVYYAAFNSKLKKDIITKDEHIKQLEEERRKYAGLIQDTVVSINNYYIEQNDSIVSELSELKDSAKENLIKVKDQYKKLVSKLNPSSSNREIQKEKQEVENKIVNEVKKLNSLPDTLAKFKQKNIPKYTIYTQYMKEKEKVTFDFYNKYYKDSKITLNKPELINYEFTSSVKYFNIEDKKKAEEIALKLKYPIEFIKADSKIMAGYIEVWVGKNVH